MISYLELSFVHFRCFKSWELVVNINALINRFFIINTFLSILSDKQEWFRDKGIQKNAPMNNMEAFLVGHPVQCPKCLYLRRIMKLIRLDL